MPEHTENERSQWWLLVRDCGRTGAQTQGAPRSQRTQGRKSSNAEDARVKGENGRVAMDRRRLALAVKRGIPAGLRMQYAVVVGGAQVAAQ